MNLGSLCGQKPAFPKGVPADQLSCHFADGHKGDHSWVKYARTAGIMARTMTDAESELQHILHEAKKLK